MRRRYKLLFLGVILSSCIFFGKSTLLRCTGSLAKAAISYSKGWEFNYSSISWKDKAVVFHDVSLTGPSFFSLDAPEISLSLPSQEIRVSNPRVCIDPLLRKADATRLALESHNPLKGVFDFFDYKWPSLFTFLVKDGEVVFGDSEKAFFVFEGSQEKANLSLIDGASKLSITRTVLIDKTFVDVISNQFPMSFISKWVSHRCEGNIDGELHLVKEGLIWTVLDGTIEAEGIGFSRDFENFSGKLEFAGPVFGYDLLQILEKSRFRLALDDGDSPLAEHIKGALSFDGQAGAKWGFHFAHQDQKMQSSGRGFFRSLEGRWIESSLFTGSGGLESSIALHMREKEDEYHLDIHADSVQEGFLSWVQEVLDVFEIPRVGWDFERGTIHGSAQLCLNKSGGLTWEVQDFLLENLALRGENLLVSCEKAIVKEGTYSFSGGEISVSDEILGTNWKGKGDLSNFLGSISGEIGSLSLDANYRGNFDLLFASLKIGGAVDGEVSLQGSWVENGFQFALRDGCGTLFSSYQIEAFRLDGEASSQGLSLFDVKGVLDAGKKVPFYAPIIETNGIFDLRFEKPLFDLARFVGTSKSGWIALDKSRSHILGSCIDQGIGSVSKGCIEGLEIACSIPWKVVPFFLDVPNFFKDIGEEDSIKCSLLYEKNKDLSLNLASQIGSIDVDLNVFKKNGAWSLAPSTVWNWDLMGDFAFEKGGIQITQAKGKSLDGIETSLSGRIVSLDQWDLQLSRLFIDLGAFQPTKDLEIQGFLEGEGMVYWKGGLESDFDFTASGLKIRDINIENEGPLNLYCSSKKGIFIRGIAANHLNIPARCKVGLFQYIPQEDAENLFTFADAEFDLPPEFLAQFGLVEKGPSFAVEFFNQSLRGTADISLSADFSKVAFSMKRANVFFEEKEYALQNLHFDLLGKQSHLNFDLVYPSRTIPIDLAFHTDPSVRGRLMIENGLKIDWTYRDGFFLEAIDGKCSGVEASFHKETDSLIGSAHLNGNELKNFLPQKIAKVFDELKIGNGYELMGRLSLKERNLCFRGLLSGKQIDLFGFEFKNILGKIEWDANHFLVSDLKVSDFAGTLKVDQILAEQVEDAPWTLSIPHIVVTELRPSLLQDVGSTPGEISPLVVRELKIDDFKGLVEDRNTYTAKGELFFINSYKRGSSLLELPSDLLSRIVGLDLDLLVPVCGSLKYELHDGFFHFTELNGSYSENKRSEFFLAFDERPPKMDLDWNLEILIKMRQFVLFKFTESLMISVSGKLDDPKFNLQRKKRFFGVL